MIVPKTLAENSGFDVQDSVIKLVDEHVVRFFSFFPPRSYVLVYIHNFSLPSFVDRTWSRVSSPSPCRCLPFVFIAHGSAFPPLVDSFVYFS